MNSTIKGFIKKYVEDIRGGNAAIFAGAGLSSGSGYVDWKELLRDIANELDLDVDKEHDLIRLAQYYVNQKTTRGDINQQLVNEFTKNARFNINHEIIASLPIKTYWTTNYDDLIEKSLIKLGKIVDDKKTTASLSINKPNRDAIVYKMHGDISIVEEAVLTKDDYEGYNEKRQVFTTALQGDLITKTFLFIGFSFDDPNLEYILSRIRILLGKSARQHYCFLRNVNRKKYSSDAEYEYALKQQEHRILDLKRYNIQVLSVDEYDEITQILDLIKIKINRNNIFISGAAIDYGKWSKIDTEKFVFDLSNELSKGKNKIISGFGLGIGSSVINGVLEYVYKEAPNHLNKYLVMHPFPQNISDDNERKKMWTKYRKDMLKNAGIAIFLFGNKLGDDNKLLNSDGMLEEFEIAVANDVKIIPVGCTGFMAEELWKKIKDNFSIYYPGYENIRDLINKLENVPDNKAELIKIIQDIIDRLQK